MAETQREDGKKISLRDWYVSHYCDEDAVNVIVRVQNSLPKYQALQTKYFEFLSVFGEPPFYTFFIPVMFWIGLTKEAALFCTMMSVTTSITDNLKDLFACPRPPSPPLRRAGKESHGLEYGMPSSHTALGMMCTYHICLLFSIVFPNWTVLIWLLGINFMVQTGYSRVYLGLHWVGDLVAGVGVFGFCWLLQEAFLREVVYGVMASPVFPWYVLLVSHVAVIFNVAPKDPCPCYEDTCRFIGAATGSVIGAWKSSGHPLVLLRVGLPHVAQGSRIATLRFWVEFVIGVVIIAVGKMLAAFVAPRVLKPLYTALCGAHLDRVPKPLQGAYLGVCTVAGWLMWKTVHRHGLPSSASEFPLQVVTSRADSVPDSSDNGSTLSPTAGGGGHHRGQIWSLRTHNFWWLWDIHTKSITYMMVGYSATVFTPAVVVYLLGMPDQ